MALLEEKLFDAVENESLDQLRQLMFSPVLSLAINHPNSKGQTLLWLASSKGLQQFVEILVKIRGVELNKLSAAELPVQETPLHVAARNNHLAVLKLLLEKGADSNTRDSLNRSAWTVAHPELREYVPQPRRKVTDLSPRHHVVNEIVTTERDYLADLDLICKWQEEFQSFGTITGQQIKTLFANVKQLKDFNTTEVFQRIQVNLDALNPDDEIDSVELGDIFLNLAGKLSIYTEYTAQQSPALALIQTLLVENSEFVQFHNALLVENEVSRGLNLFGFLIKPVQRLCKYPLLIRELMNNTKKDSQEYENLKLAEIKLAEAVAEVNATQQEAEKKTQELIEQVLKVESTVEGSEKIGLSADKNRRLVHYGPIEITQGKKRKEAVLYLFNNMALVATITNKKEKQKLVGHMEFRKMVFVNLSDNEAAGLKHSIQLSEEENHLIIHCKNLTEKQEWIKLLKSGLNDFLRQKTKRLEASKVVTREAVTDRVSVITPTQGMSQPLTVDEMLKLKMKDPQSGVKIETKKWAFKKIPMCWAGSEAVDWMLEANPACKSRQEAVDIFKKWQKTGDFTLVGGIPSLSFSDGQTFYRFKDHEPDKTEDDTPKKPDARSKIKTLLEDTTERRSRNSLGRQSSESPAPKPTKSRDTSSSDRRSTFERKETESDSKPEEVNEAPSSDVAVRKRPRGTRPETAHAGSGGEDLPVPQSDIRISGHASISPQVSPIHTLDSRSHEASSPSLEAITEKYNAERLALEQTFDAKITAEKLVLELELTDKTPTEREEIETAFAERILQEKAEAERLIRQREEAERAEGRAAKRAAKKAEAEKEAERIATERAAAEKAKRAARRAAEKAAAEKAAEEAELAKLEAEILAEKYEEKLAAERAAIEKAAAEKAAAEIAAALKLAAEKAAAEKIAAEERAVAEREAAEKLAAERAEMKRLAAERAAAEKAAAEKAAAEKAAADKAAVEQAAEELLRIHNAGMSTGPGAMFTRGVPGMPVMPGMQPNMMGMMGIHPNMMGMQMMPGMMGMQGMPMQQNMMGMQGMQGNMMQMPGMMGMQGMPMQQNMMGMQPMYGMMGMPMQNMMQGNMGMQGNMMGNMGMQGMMQQGNMGMPGNMMQGNMQVNNMMQQQGNMGMQGNMMQQQGNMGMQGNMPGNMIPESNQPNCNSCGTPVDQNHVAFNGQRFHSHCIPCSKCGGSLGSSHQIVGNKYVLCMTCYAALLQQRDQLKASTS